MKLKSLSVSAVLALTAAAVPGVSRAAESHSFIVVLKDGTARSATARIARGHGGRVRRTFGTVLNGYAAAMTEAQARRAAADPSVAYVERETWSRAAQTQDDPPSWGLDRIDQRDLPLDHAYTYAGTAGDVTAYVVDTGLRTSHAQFQGRASIGVDEVGDGRGGADCNGHGTHVAGTVGGRDHGVAKGVRLVAVRVLNCDGRTGSAAIIAAADWITAHAAKPAVVNMSINGPASRSEDDAIRRSIAAGITWVVSSGNDNADACRNSPGRIAEAIVVNNADSGDRRKRDSNFGTCTDLFAPGTGIVSTWNTGDTATKTLSGTSMAAPHVTGAAALWLSAHPGASPAGVQAALTAAATPGKVRDAGAGSPNRLLFTGTAAGTATSVRAAASARP